VKKTYTDHPANYYFGVALAYQQKGYFIIADCSQVSLPLPSPKDFNVQNSPTGYTSDLGPVLWKYPLYLAENGPEQPRLARAHAKLFPGYLEITNTETDETINLDTDKTDLRAISSDLNSQLIELGWCVIDYESDASVNFWTIENDSARAYLQSIVLDRTNNEVVAAMLYSDSDQILKAIYSSLVAFNRHALKLTDGDTELIVFGARRRYRSLDTKIPGTNITTKTLFHPLSGLAAKDYVYCIFGPEDDKEELFYNVLDRCIPCALLQTWSLELIKAGVKAGLVSECLAYGNILSAWRIDLDIKQWEELISENLINRTLVIDA